MIFIFVLLNLVEFDESSKLQINDMTFYYNGTPEFQEKADRLKLDLNDAKEAAFLNLRNKFLLMKKSQLRAMLDRIR